jgi:hypothetical protein
VPADGPTSFDHFQPGSKVYLIATKSPIFTFSALVKGGVITESGLLKFFFWIVMQISVIHLTVMGIKRIVWVAKCTVKK